MKMYRTVLLLTAFLLFLTALTAVALPNEIHLALQLVVPALGLYSAIQCRPVSLQNVVGLLMVAIFYNPLTAAEYDERTARIIAIAIVAVFIRLAFKPDLQVTDHEKQ